MSFTREQQQKFANLMGLAQHSHKKGDLEMAVNLYRESLKIIRDQPDALHMLGIALSTMGKEDKAIECLVKAVNSMPDNPAFLVNLGEVYLKSKKYQEANEVLTKAIALKPDFAEAYHKLANVLRALGKYEESINLYRRTLELNPKNAMALYNLGNAMLETGNYTSAINYYQESVKINPNYPFAHNNLGIALQEWDRLDEAIQHYIRALQLKPDMKEAIRNTALLYDKQGKYSEAKQLYQQLVKLSPGNKALKFQTEIISPVIHSGQDAIDEYRNHLKNVLSQYSSDDFLDIKEMVEYNAYPPSDLVYQGKDDKEIKEKFATLFEGIKRADINHHNTKPHIGFVVTSGHEGVFIKCMRGILNNLDTNIFDISIVCSLPNGEKILRPVIHNPEIKYISMPKDFSLALEKVSNARFDVLHYWEIGTDAFNYFLALSKPSKIQCCSWGWPTTSGMKEVDYFISSRHLETEQGEKYYTEKLIRFNRLPVFYYRPPVPVPIKSRTSYNLPEEVPLYLCQQNLRKVHPDFDLVIDKILKKDSKGIILFIEDKQESITAILKKRLETAAGDNSGRIIFMKRMEEGEYLGLLTHASVALDTFHYGGGANTTYDAFECGTPLITMPSEMHKGRFAYAAYQQMGMNDCIAKTADDYVDLAVNIANNSELRKKIVSAIQDKQTEIFEDKNAVKELSDFFISVCNSLAK